MKATDFISNEIKAQEASKVALLEASDHVLEVYSKAIEEGIIKDIEVEMEVWNRGYEININPIFNNRADSENVGIEPFRMYIQPCSFFNKYYERNEASFEIGISFGCWNSISDQQDINGEIKVDVEKIKQQIDKII